jgi:hypothetical protein
MDSLHLLRGEQFVGGQSYFEVMKKCPVCSSKEGARVYLYGMSSEEPDPTKFVIGGCCFSDDMPDYKCITYQTDFYKESAKYQKHWTYSYRG